MRIRTQPHDLTVYVLEQASPIRTRQLRMLRTVAGMQVVGTGTDPDSDLPAIEALSPDVVLVGLRTGQSLRHVRLLTATLPESIVIVLSNSGSSLMRRACLRAGGSYCFDKTLEVDELHSALLEIASRGQRSSGP